MEHIIYDCDNTFGVPECPVDDGLALLYLLGKPEAHILGVTTTYGNSRVEVVYENTRNMLKDMGRNDIPVLMGGKSRKDRTSEAAKFLVERANRHRGQLKILATGALTNLYAAYELDHDFFDKVSEIVLMGGITQPLLLNGIQLDELNLSCDPDASYCVLTEGKNVSVATGNNCLPAYMSHEDYKTRLLASGYSIGKYIYEKTKNWFDVKVKVFDLNGFYNWDIVAAVYLLEKGFFVGHLHEYQLIKDDLIRGYIGSQQAPYTHTINLPTILNVNAFRDEIFCSWFRVNFPSQ